MSVPIKSSDGFVFWVKEEFIRRCSNPQNHDTYDLINNYSLISFLHKEDGPAVPSSNGYFLNGGNVAPELIERVKFIKKLEDILND